MINRPLRQVFPVLVNVDKKARVEILPHVRLPDEIIVRLQEAPCMDELAAVEFCRVHYADLYLVRPAAVVVASVKGVLDCL